MAELKSKSFEGDATVAKIRANLDRLEVGWYGWQQQLIDDALVSLLPVLYKADWEAHKAEILAAHRRTKDRPICVYDVSRKHGKTTIAVALVAAVTAVLPLRVAVFDVSEHRTHQFANAVAKAWERLAISGPAPLVFYQSAKARGIQPDWVVVDNGQAVPVEWYEELVLWWGKASLTVVTTEPAENAGLLRLVRDSGVWVVTCTHRYRREVMGWKPSATEPRDDDGLTEFATTFTRLLQAQSPMTQPMASHPQAQAQPIATADSGALSGSSPSLDLEPESLPSVNPA